VIQPWDLPITKGLQETIHRFRLINAELQLTDYGGGAPPKIAAGPLARRHGARGL